MRTTGRVFRVDLLVCSIISPIVIALLMAGCVPVTKSGETSGTPAPPEESASVGTSDYVITGLSALTETGKSDDVYVLVSAAAISNMVQIDQVGADLANMGAIVPYAQITSPVPLASIVIAPREDVDPAKIFGDIQASAGFTLSDTSIYITSLTETDDQFPHFKVTVAGKFEAGLPAGYEDLSSQPAFESDCTTCERHPGPVCPWYCAAWCYLCKPAETLTEYTIGGPSDEYVVTTRDKVKELSGQQVLERVLVVVPPGEVSDKFPALEANTSEGTLVAVPMSSGIAVTDSTLVLAPRDAVAQEDVLGTWSSEEPIQVSANKAIVLSAEEAVPSEKIRSADVVGVFQMDGMQGQIESSKGVLSIDMGKVDFPTDPLGQP